MVEAFDRIVVEVPDLAVALDEYTTLVGAAVRSAAKTDGASAVLPLGNTALELRQIGCSDSAERGPGADAATDQAVDAQIAGLVLRDASRATQPVALANSLALHVSVSNGSATPRCSADLTVDHLVLRTDDAEACIRFFGEQLGIRLALDKTVPEWGGRMLFFRTGRMTLEVIAPDEKPRASAFWGIAYQHADLERLCGELASRGVECSSIREGRKPGTLVATVKSHCLGIPTLLIQPAPVPA